MQLSRLIEKLAQESKMPRAFSLFKIWSVSLIWFLFFFHVNPVDSVMMVNWKRFISSCLSLFVFCVLLVSLFFLFVFFILPGKREASPMSQEQAPKKKPKTEDDIVSKPSPIASLVAYGEDDSSDEEGSASPETKQMSSRQSDNGDSRRGGNLPFWAVRR